MDVAKTGYGKTRLQIKAKRVGGARVLTSSECVNVLKQREEKKRILIYTTKD